MYFYSQTNILIELADKVYSISVGNEFHKHFNSTINHSAFSAANHFTFNRIFYLQPCQHRMKSTFIFLRGKPSRCTSITHSRISNPILLADLSYYAF